MFNFGALNAQFAKLKTFLGAFYNLFPLGGATGGIIVRQKGAGTNEAQLFHDGTQLVLKPMQSSPNGNVRVVDSNNNVFLETNSSSGVCVIRQSLTAFGTTGGQTNYRLDSSGYAWLALDLRFIDSSGNRDSGLRRIAAKVAAPSDGTNAGAGWIQNTAGRARLTADAAESAGTLTNLTDLSLTLIASRKYTGLAKIPASNTQSTEGLQFDFNGGTATMTSFRAGFEGQPIGATLGNTMSTALNTALTATAVSTSDQWYVITLSFVCNASGTFIPRFGENSHTLGTATARLGGYLWLEDTP